MIKAGIIGGAGYTGGELIRILLNHPGVEIGFVQSSSQADKPVGAVHKDLIGDTALVFTGQAYLDQVDVLFLCQGHGKSTEFFGSNKVPADLKTVDLSQDFRLDQAAEGMAPFVYGLPELNKERIVKSQNIANPGCFATAIQLAVLPLAGEGLIRDELHVHAITGSTGAGQSLSTTTHFSWRNNNVSIYKAFTHQHLAEIKKSLNQLQPGLDQAINFIPVRGNFSRGILASVYTSIDRGLEEIKNLYQEFYQDHPFTSVTDESISLKEAVNTNKCLLHLESHGKKLLITSVIDNLIKGASGQAVQNMNLMFAQPETEGLKFKSIAF